MPVLGRVPDPFCVCLMIVIVPQVGRFTISTSSGCEVKLDPEERDTQVWLAMQGSAPPPPALTAWVRLIPNSANALVGRSAPLMPLSAPAIGLVLMLPSKRAGSLMSCSLPQHGALSWGTKQP